MNRDHDAGRRSLALLSAVPLLLLGAAAPSPPGALGLLTALALAVGLGSAALRTSRWLLPEISSPSRATSALVLAAAMAVVPATFLGHFGLLGPRLFLAVEASLIAASAAVKGRRRPAAKEAAGDDCVPAWLSRGEAALLVTAGAAAVLGLAAVAAGPELYEPPSKLDDPSYHLSAVAVWHHHRDLRMIKFPAGDGSTAFYPIGGELIDWALLAPLRESDFLVRWSQVPFALGSLAALAAVGLHLGLSRRSAALAPLLYLTVGRAFPALMFSAGNDHGTAFYTLAAIDAILVLGKARTGSAAAYAGLALGLLAGTKYIGLLYALTLLVPLAAALGRPELRAVAVLCGGALAAGGYTYLRNAWSTGNPVFPAPVDFLGIHLPGWPEVTLAVRSHLPEFAIDLEHFLLVRTHDFGHLFRFTMLPAAVLAPAVSPLLRDGARRTIVRTLVLSLPAAFFLQFLLLMHDHRENRYFFAAVALAAGGCCWLVELLAGRWPRGVAVARAVLAGLVAYKFIQTDATSIAREMATGLALLGLAGLGAASWTSLKPWLVNRRAALAGVALLLAFGSVLPLARTLDRYQEVKYDANLVVGYLDERGGSRGVTVAYAGGNRPYPLFGGRLQHRVEIVPRAGRAEDRFYRWGGSAEFPTQGGSYTRWRRNLRRLGVGYVVIALGDAQEPEHGWVSAHPRDFERVFVHASTEVWRFTDLDAPLPPSIPAPPLQLPQ